MIKTGNLPEKARSSTSPATNIRRRTTLNVTLNGSEGRTAGSRVPLETSTPISNLQLYAPISSP